MFEVIDFRGMAERIRPGYLKESLTRPESDEKTTIMIPSQEAYRDKLNEKLNEAKREKETTGHMKYAKDPNVDTILSGDGWYYFLDDLDIPNPFEDM